MARDGDWSSRNDSAGDADLAVRPAPSVDVADFAGQFLVSRSRRLEATNWETLESGGWIISRHASLPLHRIRLVDGTPIGCFLGHPITEDGHLLDGTCSAPFASLAEVTDEGLEAFLFSFGGRFASLVVYGEAERLYLDPLGSLALVYALDRQEVAATTTLLGSTAGYGRPWLAAGMEAYPGQNQYYPAGLTGDPRIGRLLPGHYLDLRTWTPVRHWPTPDFRSSGPESVPGLVSRIARRVSTNISAMAKGYEVYLGLTAGADSRVMLACSRDHLDRIGFVTFRSVRRPNPDDVEGAVYLARRLGLNHRVIQAIPEDQPTRDYYNLRTGHCGHPGKASAFLDTCRRHLDLRRAWLIGYGGEVGRARYSRPDDRPNERATAAGLVGRLRRVPSHAAFVAAMERWLRGVEWADYHLVHDLLYLEHRMGAWAAPHLYGIASFALVATPFCHREIVESMLELPFAFRVGQELPGALVREAWPEIAGWPLQRAGGIRGWLGHTARRWRGSLRARGRRARRRLRSRMP